jgi:hypothetical protein
MISDALTIRKMKLFFVFPRHWINNLSHRDFLCSNAARRAYRNFSGLTSYFTERKARYSPIDFLCLRFLHLIAPGF